MRGRETVHSRNPHDLLRRWQQIVNAEQAALLFTPALHVDVLAHAIQIEVLRAE